MSEQWLLVAAVMTPPTLILIVLVTRYERLYKLVDRCTNWIDKLILRSIDRWVARPPDRKMQEKRRQQREMNLLLWHKEQMERDLLSHKRPH